MKTHWENGHEGACHYVQITRNEVIAGHHYGSGHTDSAGSVSHAEFLAGRYQDLVRAAHGEAVLAEVVAAVRGVDEHPSFREERARVTTLRAALDAVPLDAELGAIFRDPATENGGSNYGNEGGYRSRVASDGMVLEFEGGSGELRPMPGVPRPRRKVGFRGHASGAVALHDHFLVVAGDTWVYLGPDGRTLDDGTRRPPAFGNELRIRNVHRHGEVLLVSDQWFDHRDGAPGALRYAPGEGYTARWEET